MTLSKATMVSLAALMVLGGCASQPIGPMVGAYPPPGKSPAQFQQEDGFCRQQAQNQTAGAVDQANNRQAGTAVLGTVLGAGLGAAVGGGQGAAIGAASGAVVGTAAGAGPADQSQAGIQRRYDIVYSQCMYSYGNSVPGMAPPPPAPAAYPPPPPGGGYPPPPGGGYPPPPGAYPPPNGAYPPPQ